MVTIATILNVTASLILYEMLFIQPVTCGACGDTKSQCTPQNETKFDFRRVLKENRKYSPRVNICNLRIYGGIAAKICDVPYQVAIRRKKSTGRVWRTFCGGAIVTKNHVVTAAHCFDRGTKKFIEETRVAAGADHSDVHLFGDTSMRRSLLREIMIEETWRQIKDCYKHAHYSTTLVHHDIAVLVLNRPLKFSSKIQPIPMLTKQTRSTLDADIPCLTSGFGIMDHGKSSPTLRFVCVAVVPIDWCRLTYQSMELLGEFQICAGGSGKDSCQGDSGSPMACQGLLSGIVSYGGECGAAPGVYTLLSGYTHGNYVPFVRSFSIKLNHNIIEIMFVVHPFVYYMMFSY